MVFIMLRYIPSIPNLFNIFIRIDVEFYKFSFLHLLRWSYDFFILHSIDVLSCLLICIYWTILASLGWIPLTWSLCIIMLMCYWIWCANILLRIFVYIFIIDISPWSYQLCSYVFLEIGCYWLDTICLEKFLPFLFLAIIKENWY
jgi:hypothetical protein